MIAATIRIRRSAGHGLFGSFDDHANRLCVAIVVGFCWASAIGSSSAVYTRLYPLLIGFNVVPKVAVVPLM